jgi:beta-glucosidase
MRPLLERSLLGALLTAAALASTACSSTPAPPDAADAQPSADATDITLPPDAPDDSAPVDACAPPWSAPFTPTPRAHFPASFLWGSATAPYQIEGGLDNTDWGQWDLSGHAARMDHANDGPHSLTQYTQDIAALTATGQNAYRMGIEWARVFPTRAAWDACHGATGDAAARAATCHAAASPEGLAYYHTVLAAVRAAHITPLVTLQHFSLPTYLSDLSQDWMTQGWMRGDIADHFAAWAGFVASEYGGEVDWWVTINEPMVVATVGYLDGHAPPGQRLQIDAIVTVVNHMVRAHVAAYDAIHANDTRTAESAGPITPLRPALVSIAQHVRRFFGARCTDRRDATAADRADALFNRLFYEAIVRGNLDANANGTLDPGEPANDPALRGRADYVGINYYSLTAMLNNAAIPLLGALPQDDTVERGLPKTDYGWDIYPRGFVDELTWAGSYALPIVITENGIADATGANRPRFIAEHLAALAYAIQAGVNVVGYFHWSVIDNFEWTAGYCPRFGLYAVDFTDPNRARSPRPGADVFRAIIQAGEVSDALLAAQPAYTRPSAFCPLGVSGLDGGM